MFNLLSGEKGGGSSSRFNIHEADYEKKKNIALTKVNEYSCYSVLSLQFYFRYKHCVFYFWK